MITAFHAIYGPVSITTEDWNDRHLFVRVTLDRKNGPPASPDKLSVGLCALSQIRGIKTA